MTRDNTIVISQNRSTFSNASCIIGHSINDVAGECENNFELYANHVSIASAWECLPTTRRIIISGYHISSGLFWGSSSACSEYYQHQHLSRHMIISMAGGITSVVVRSNKRLDIIGRSCEIQSQQYLLIYDRCPRPPHYPLLASKYQHKYRYTKHKYECTANTSKYKQIQAKHN